MSKSATMPAIRNASRYSRMIPRLFSSATAVGAIQRMSRASAKTARPAMRMVGVIPEASALSLFDAGGFVADAILQVEKLCAPHEAAASHFDLLDARRVDEERSFDADAMGDPTDGEALGKTAVLALDDDA